MSDLSKPTRKLPPEQQAIRDKCFHPSGTFVEFKKDEIEQSIPERFEKMVRFYPDRIAVKAEDRSLTYDELNQAANRIAHALLVQRGKQEEPIGLVLGHGVEAVTAILGVLKAGKMYVPLDPSFPMSRNRDVLEDSEPGLIVTDNKNFPLAVELASKKLALINIDEFHRSYPVENTDLRTAPDTFAYILYTSGSTGKPKGVVQNHRNVLHLIMRHTNRAHISPDDRIAVLRSFSVHGGTLQTFGGLLNGAAILPFDTKREGVQELAHWLVREEITLCRMGPTLFRHLAEVLGKTDHFPKLREISFSGEPLHKNDVELWGQHFSDECIMVNSFGATEVSSCCEYLVDKKTRIEDGVVPCGYPTGDMEIVLLQDDGRETRFGEIGEIAVKSRYLALEYWRKPELTRAKFLPVPKGGDERIYFTGDLGRMLSDGLLVHLWRKDFQVKIRGYRVELAEVESTLLTLDNIKEAVVVGWEHQALEKRLVAYVVPDRMPAPSTTTLRRAIGEKLPDYMVPAAFVVLDAMPLTPNGKVDRSALSAPTGSRPDLDTPYAPPRSLIEEKVAGIWVDVLGLDHVGIHDSFLDLGGHSLAATRVTSRIYADYQVDLPLTQLFKTPTIAELADYIERLHPSHRKVKHSPIRPVSREENLTLSFSQQRLWFLSQLEPDNPVYNEPKALRIRGSLDIYNLKKALNAIVARHEVLHTIFFSIDGNPVAALNENRSVALPLIDLSERPTVHREAEVRHLLREVTHRPFNLGRDLMLRAALFRMDKEDHVLLLVVHHIASDGWSSTIFFRELSALYQAYAKSKPSPLAPLPLQYADFAVWQRQWLQGEVVENQLSYWKKQLEGAPAILNLPTDRPRPAVQSFGGATQSIELSRELTGALKALSRKEGATLFMTLLAAFQTLLYRYTGQEDIVVGSPIAGRNRQEIEGLIGFFVNTLVLRTDLSGNPTFRELLQRVRKRALEAYEHQDLPFEKLVEELHPERNLSYSPLFQVMFVLQNAPSTVWEFDGLAVRSFAGDSETAKFDLTLSMREEAGGLRGSLQYSTDLFDGGTIKRMLGHFEVLLESIVGNPDQRISALPILTEAERYQLLVEWNDTKREYPKDKCIHELFEEQVERTPEGVAVVFEGRQLTYRELNRRANQVAHYLIKQGVEPETLVGICVERSFEMVVGILGILKAGGAYVPLDPSYPKERLGFMMGDARLSVVLTLQRLVEFIPEHSASIVCLDANLDNIAREGNENASVGVRSGNLAYILYTSGSTGRPKAVAIEHRSPVALLSWARTVFTAADLAGVLASTSICFDLSVFELFAPLTSGGRVLLVESVLALPKLRAASEVTLINTVPSVITELLQLGGIPPSVRTINLAGEPLKTKLVRQIYETTSANHVYDLYGPSEDTTYSTCALRTPEGPHTIGRPIANTQIFLLDRHLQPVPVGVTGELYLGGDGLARGYLNRPELTQEKFIADPFDSQPGARLYKTGDLARYLADGNIEFLGRIDHQVKIRGYRIELGEIESVLGQHPGVRESVVLGREDTPGDPSTPLETGKRLVAYVVPNQEPAPAIHELRSFLKQQLPEYMVPSAYEFLDSLPLTANGKVDRRALPMPDRSRPELDETFSASRTPVEELLANIWAEVLKLDNVGIHDNFFEMGGHSLLATQVISRMRGALQLEIPVRALFETPTVAGLAVRIEAIHQKEQGVQTLPILPVSRDKDLPLSFAQQRLWFLDQYESGSSVYNIPSAIRLTGALDVSALEQSLQEIVNRHEALRTTFSMVEGEAVQVIAPSLKLALAVVDLRDHPEGEREEEARRLVREEARRHFDLAEGPLFRSKLLRLGEDDHVLVLTMHHIVSDGWSMGVLYGELSMVYRAFVNGEPSPLADLPIQYADFAVWQREWLQGEVLDSQLSYWKKQLEGIPWVLNLPTDRPRLAVPSHRGARQSFVLSKELSGQLKALSRKEGVTLFMTLLAAFQTLLHRHTGEEDIVVGSPIANRNRSEIEGLIGFFVNTLVLRTNLSGNPTFKELLAGVKETTLGAYAHQDLPFEKLVEEIHPERGVNRTPLFQVLFNMANQEDSKLGLLGLTVERISSSQPESKFDLTLYVRQENGQIRFNLVYRVDLFNQPRMTCFLQQYEYLLEQIVAGPEKPIGSYSLVTPESRPLLPDPSIILVSPPQQLVTSIFWSWSKRIPTHPAISQGQQTWSYAELAQSAGTLARLIVASGLAPREVVAVYGQPSFGLIAAMIATFLSGGVLLPLDRTLPIQRKQRILREAKAKRLLYVGIKHSDDAWLEESFASGILFIDPQNGCALETEAGEDLQSNRLPKVETDDPAYIFFTSGTTGVPKGVLGCHKGLSHFLSWQRETFAIGSGDRVAQLTALSFDAVLRDIFLPLASGATLCLPDANDALTPDPIIEWLERQQITVLHAVPSLAQSWLASEGAKVDLGSMRWVFFVGEPLTEAFVRQWRTAFHNTAEIVNLYGPTETTLVKCFYRVPVDLRPGVQPVGRPIPNTQAMVLNDHNQLCGISEPGEIVLRTPFRSLGYINAPEENRKRFVKNPFRDDAHDLLYFTGDAGRYQPNGTLEILGRLDDQVKIRGVRIEPAEVAATLARYPAVESSFVVAVKNEQDEICLMAYVVPSKQQKTTSTQLRSYLVERLPAAMLPAFFVFLDSLPLTPNGKVDRKALPVPDQSRPELGAIFVRPRNPVEEMLAGIWAEVLRVERVGIHDNFFDLGGHSLLATQVISRLRDRLPMELPLRTLFEKPTIATLATAIMEKRAEGVPAEPDIRHIG